jgi:hypothetical protein
VAEVVDGRRIHMVIFVARNEVLNYQENQADDIKKAESQSNDRID